MLNSRLNIDLSKRYRWLIVAILVLAVLFGYLARMSVSVALPTISDEMGWSSSQKGSLGGILMGIFLVSYGFSNIYFSRYIDKYGAKLMLAISVATWSLAVIIGAYFSEIYFVFIFSRLLLGLGQGVLYPTCSKVVAGWFEAEKRARANSFYMAGGPLGVMLAPIIMTPVIVNQSWEWSFYLIAALGFILLLPILIFLRDRAGDNDDEGTGVLELFRRKRFQIILIGFTAMTAVWWGITLWVPTYLVEGKGIPISDISYGASLPYFGAVISMVLGSWISDVTGYRKRIILFSLFSTAIMITVLTVLPIKSKETAMGLLFVIFFVGQLAPPLFFTMLQRRVSGDVLGSATGVMNGVGNGVGVIGPLSVGFVISITGSYDQGLLALAVIAFVGGVSLLIFSKSN